MVTDLKDIVSRLSYKPGWTFTLTSDLLGDTSLSFPVLKINAKVPHSTTLEPVTFEIRRIIPVMCQDDEKYFLRWVETVLAEAEIHEMREFFRFDGELVDNPHATVKKDK